MNNTDVIITSTMLTIEQRNNPDNQMTAVLTKEQAARIIKALSEWHKIEPPNIPKLSHARPNDIHPRSGTATSNRRCVPSNC
jgi:hypothetical protein